jgi:hypothetical protein
VTFYWARVKALIAQFSDSAGYQDWYAALYREDAAGWRDAQRAFVELARICREHGIALQVVLLPELHDLVDYPFTAEYAKVTRFLDANGIENLDLTPFFLGKTHPESLWVAPDDAHPNAVAHRRIADSSVDFFRARAAADSARSDRALQ